MTSRDYLQDKMNIAKGLSGVGPVRVSGDGAAVVQDAGIGMWGEAALKGQVFHGVSTTNTIAAGNLVGASAAASTNTCLLNPAASGALLVLQKVTICLQSGTPTAGTVYHGIVRDCTVATSVTGFAQGLPGNNYSSATAQGYVLDSDAGVALTGGTAPVTYGAFGGGLSAAALTTGLVIPPLMDIVGGAIVLGPGDAYLPLFTGAGTTVIANTGYVWTEVALTA